MAEAGQIKTVDKFVFLGYILESKAFVWSIILYIYIILHFGETWTLK